MPGWLKYTVGSIFLSDEADLGFRFRYMGGRPYTPQEWFAETRTWRSSSDLLNSERYPDYHRLDLRWDHKFLFERWSLSWYLDVQNVYNRKNVWWYWYGSEYEAHGYYLKLLSRIKPQSKTASRLVKYLLNNRKHATYWKSTRDTAIIVEAFAEYLTASGEDRPDLVLDIYYDGVKKKAVKISAENLFTFDNKFVLEGKYDFRFGFSAYLNIIHLSDIYFYSRKRPLQKRESNEYTLLNAKISQDLLNDRLTLYLGADNLLDEDYEESYGFPQAGRMVYGGLKVAF